MIEHFPNHFKQKVNEAYLIEWTIDGYALTQQGENFYQLLNPLGRFAKDWAKNFNSVE